MEGALFSLALFVAALTDGIRKSREARDARVREYRRLAEGLDVDGIVKERALRREREEEWAFLDEHIARTPFGRTRAGRASGLGCSLPGGTT